MVKRLVHVRRLQRVVVACDIGPSLRRVDSFSALGGLHPAFSRRRPCGHRDLRRHAGRQDDVPNLLLPVSNFYSGDDRFVGVHVLLRHAARGLDGRPRSPRQRGAHRREGQAGLPCGRADIGGQGRRERGERRGDGAGQLRRTRFSRGGRWQVGLCRESFSQLLAAYQAACSSACAPQRTDGLGGSAKIGDGTARSAAMAEHGDTPRTRDRISHPEAHTSHEGSLCTETPAATDVRRPASGSGSRWRPAPIADGRSTSAAAAGRGSRGGDGELARAAAGRGRRPMALARARAPHTLAKQPRDEARRSGRRQRRPSPHRRQAFMGQTRHLS